MEITDELIVENASSVEINLSDYSAGTYVIRLAYLGQTFYEKLIVY